MLITINPSARVFIITPMMDALRHGTPLARTACTIPVTRPDAPGRHAQVLLRQR